MKSLTKLVLRKSVIVVLACVCGVTAVYFGGQKAEEAVQTLATRPPYEPPTIVLDAGAVEEQATDRTYRMADAPP